MSINQKLVQHGTISGGATPINVDMARLDHGTPVKVTLSTDYAMQHGPGIPFRPSFTGAAAKNLQYPRTIVSGTTVSLLKAEADALVAAGAASYA